MRVAITGAATGIGAATAAQLKDRDAEIVALDIAEPAANSDQWIAVDLADDASIDRAAAQLNGSFDALINCSGLPPKDDNSEPIIAVNYFGLVSLTERLLPLLAPGASIVNMASRAGEKWQGNLDQVKRLMAISRTALSDFITEEEINPLRAYMLSKEAVIVWSLANCERMIAKDIRVNCVSPSAVATDILSDFINALGERAQQAVARAGRAATAEEIASLVCFLASRDSNWIKGQNITIDGGMSAMGLTDELKLGE